MKKIKTIVIGIVFKEDILNYSRKKPRMQAHIPADVIIKPTPPATYPAGRSIAGEKSRPFYRKIKIQFPSHFCYNYATVQAGTPMTVT